MAGIPSVADSSRISQQRFPYPAILILKTKEDKVLYVNNVLFSFRGIIQVNSAVDKYLGLNVVQNGFQGDFFFECLILKKV